MKFVLIFCFFLTGCVAKNQPAGTGITTDYLVLLDDIQWMEFDPLGNLFLVDASDRLTKFDTAGQLIYNVVNNNLGRIHSIDAGNPFKIMVFYRDQQTIVMYDNTLSEIQRIPLAGWELQDVTAACLSPDNAIWIFNGTNVVLVKMSDKGDPIITSDPFNILGVLSSRPDFIFDFDQYLLIKEEGQPIAVFNDFGNYLYEYAIQGEIFSIGSNAFISNKGTSIHLNKIPGGEEIAFYPLRNNLTGKKIVSFASRFYTYDDKGVYLISPKSSKEDP